jgi:hypothetical protein
VKRFVSASQDKIYCISDAGELLVVDQETGGRIGAIPARGFDLEFINWRTDRLYLGTKFGVIQCLHDVEQEWPLVHVAGESLTDEPPPDVVQGPGEVAAGGAPPDEDPFAGAGEADPFAGGGAAEEDPFAGGGGMEEDPFGGGGGAEEDPFGGGGGAEEDPFGGGGGGAEEDPFGGGGGAGDGGADEDPFGGGGAAEEDPFG